jgi:hypothetical protein
MQTLRQNQMEFPKVLITKGNKNFNLLSRSVQPFPSGNSFLLGWTAFRHFRFPCSSAKASIS